jgi:DNA helicase-2/ATP-dependent DNA helicase PcrA
MLHAEFASENAYLQDVLAYLNGYHREVAQKKTEIDALVAYALAHNNKDNAEQFAEVVNNIATQNALTSKASETTYALNKPYFARVDFAADDEPDANGAGQADAERLLGAGHNETRVNLSRHYYIGKMTLMRGLDILITDWRAPVSSLYYEGRIGRAGYDCPDGFIEGEIFLKRQYDIQDGVIKAITDIDITTNDEFLQAALGASKDRRLKDIVTTIQAEQNRIIRAPMYTPLIVQGAAGGGKTTMALHRIAYLLYNYADKIQARQIMIIAPNRFFLSYISDVLPDLGVERVKQTTFEDFSQECLELSAAWKIVPAVNTLAEAIDSHRYKSKGMAAAHLKGLLRYKALIERYAAHIEKGLAPRGDFMLEGYELFTHEALADLFLREYAYLPVGKRAHEIHKHLVNTLRKEKPSVLQYIEADYDRRRESVKREWPDCDERRAMIAAILDERDEKIKRVKNQAKVIVRQYMRVFDMKTSLEYYQALFAEPGLLETLADGLFNGGQLALIKSQTLDALNAKRLDTDDLPALLLLQIKLFGLEDTLDIKHVVIDEAQDFSLFQLAVLKAVTVSASFSILGDLNQGIYAYKGVRDWDDAGRRVYGAAGKPAFSYMTLEQSYRTTVEVMNEANGVIERLGIDNVPLAKPVIRHGGPVEKIVFESVTACARAIDKKILEYNNEGRHSIAVVCKTAGECKALRKLLTAKPALVTGRENDYAGGLLILPCYLAKGLEFDAVIIANASPDNYRPNEALDIRLLYIAMTRALHTLTVFAVGELTGLLTRR